MKLSPFLPLYGARHRAADYKLLQYEENDYHWRGNYYRPRELDRQIVVRAHQPCKRGGKGSQRFVGVDDIWPQIVAVIPHERRYAQNYKHGLDEGQDNSEIYAKHARPLYFRRLLYLLVDAEKLLSQKEDIINAHDKRQYQRGDTLGQTEEVANEIIGNEHYRAGHHHRKKTDLENGVAPEEFKPCERVRRERVQKQICRGVHDAHNHSV